MVAHGRKRTLALAIVILGNAMMMLDLTIVNVALPTMRTSLDAGESALSWAMSGFSLANALILIPSGRLADRWGHARVFLLGIGIFGVASLCSGLAADQVQFISARVVQGLGAGIMLPTVGALIQLMYEPRERSRAFAALGATLGISGAIGPSLGGLIIQAFGHDTGWRWVFFINVPLVALAVVAGFIVLPKRTASGASGVDVIGLVLVSLALASILVPVIEGGDWGWPWWAIAIIVAGLGLLVLFAAWERRYAARGRTPLVPPRLFAHAAFTGGILLAFVYFAAFTSIFFALSLLWQSGLGQSALSTGLVVLSFSIAAVAGSLSSPRVTARLGRSALALGAGMLTVGIATLAVVLAAVPGVELRHWHFVAPMAIAGFGSGVFIAPNIQFIVATVDRDVAGSANGVANTMQRVGAALGVAVSGAVLFGLLDPLEASGLSHADAFTDATAVSLGISAVLAAAAFGLVFALPKRAGGA